MNRFVSVGLSVAVAPAILLGIARLAGWEDAIKVSEIVLYEMALPIGALLVLTGAVFSAANGAHGRRLASSLKPVISSVLARGRTLTIRAAKGLGRVSPGRWLLVIVLLLAAPLIVPIKPETVATVLLLPVFLVADSLGVRGVFAAPIVLAILGWAIARRFPKPIAVAGGCMVAFALLQWLSWDFIACKSSGCNNLGLGVLWLGLSLWTALPGLIMLVTGVFTLRKSRAQHGGQQPAAADADG